MAGAEQPFRIAQISDLHCGGPYFEASLLERAIGEINELQPDIVVCSGDLTTFGFRHEYLTAREYIDRIDCDSIVVVPGNHDSRNVGYVHFEELFGDRNSVLRKHGVAIVAIDSSEPDLDHGQIGRGRYRWIEEQFAVEANELRIFVLHHHLLPVPGTGRERNVVYDAGVCSVRACGSCSRATSTCHTSGDSRTSSLSTPAPCRRCASGAIRGLVTT
jgi:3',5'-cyclic-AMP phosphodiesterase